MAATEGYNREQLVSLLNWYRAAGVDLCVSETPVNCFDERPAHRADPSTPAVPLRQNGPSGNRSNPVHPQNREENPGRPTSAPQVKLAEPAEATALAQKAKTLDDLRQTLAQYQGCSLKQRATQLVFGDGNPKAEIMLVGEAPGRDEDIQGKPFVGRSGQLLERMLATIGLDRTNVYIANTVPWRPPGNRTPSPLEIELCLPFLVRQVELVAPKILITLGAAATQTIFEAKLSIIKVRGQWRDINIGAHQVRALPTLHPAFLLRQPAQKRQSWLDMLEVAAAITRMNIQAAGSEKDTG
jgi:uracil-DNA glycosylase